jgi:membrane protein
LRIVHWRLYIDLLKQSGSAWVADNAPSMGAALSFYSAFSLAPLLIIVIAISSAAYGQDAARGAIVAQLSAIVGVSAAQAIQALLKGAQETTNGVVATTVGAITVLVGASTVLVVLHVDIDRIWIAPPRKGSGLLTIVRARVLSLGMVLAIGFLLLVSLVLTGVVAAAGKYWATMFPGAALFLNVANFFLSLTVITVLIAMLYKWLPNALIAWRDVWIGALTTAVLFAIGQIAIGVYLGRSAIASAYGAAGALVVLLLWLYYSAQIFFLGAEFTHVYAKQRMGRPRPGGQASSS